MGLSHESEVATLRLVRAPLNLHMPDDWACTSCVTANLLYMFGLMDEPISLKDVDRLNGRQSGEPDLAGGYFLTLLGYGFTLTSVTAVDASRTVDEDGYEYMKAYYIRTGDGKVPTHYTPDYYACWKERAMQYHRLVNSLSGSRVQIVEEPSVQRLFQLLEIVPAVIVPLGFSASSVHLTIAYGVEPFRKIKLYVPNHSGSTIGAYRQDYINNRFVPGEEMTGISLP
jgi:hypothetical protein